MQSLKANDAVRGEGPQEGIDCHNGTGQRARMNQPLWLTAGNRTNGKPSTPFCKMLQDRRIPRHTPNSCTVNKRFRWVTSRTDRRFAEGLWR